MSPLRVQVSDRVFGRLRDRGVPELVLPALGGLATGLIALLDPEVLYQGWGNVNGVLDAAKGEFSPLGLAQIVALKVLATSLCRGSGLVGGLYAPSIFVGAAQSPLASSASKLQMYYATLFGEQHSMVGANPAAVKLYYLQQLLCMGAMCHSSAAMAVLVKV